MILTIDIGNSRIKWALWKSGEIVIRAVAVYEADKCSDALDRLYSDVSQLPSKVSSKQFPGELLLSENPMRVFAACVAGDVVRNALNSWVKRHWLVSVEYLETQKQYKNIVNAYDDPSQHGVDRWAGIVAACQSYPDSSLCVIGAGTAVTFDFVKIRNESHHKHYQHMGGYILPSYETMHAALLANTVKIKSVLNVEHSKQEVPSNTSDAVNQGLHILLQAGIREICEQAKNELDESMKIILTGGFAPVILNYPDMPMMTHEPDLIMKGLYGMLEQQNFEVSV